MENNSTKVEGCEQRKREGKEVKINDKIICDPTYRNPVKRSDNINFDPLYSYLKNYSTNLLRFCLETDGVTFVLPQGQVNYKKKKKGSK